MHFTESDNLHDRASRWAPSTRSGQAPPADIQSVGRHGEVLSPRGQVGGRTADVDVGERRLETGAGIVYDGNVYMV